MAEQKRGPVKPPTLDLKAKSVLKDENRPNENPARVSQPGSGPDAAEASLANKGASASKAGAKPGENTAGGATQAEDKGSAKAKDASRDAAKGPAGTTSEDTSAQSGAKPGAKRGTGGKTGAALAGGAIIGGLLGMAGAYGLAVYGFWPGAQTSQDWVTTAQLKSATAQLDQRISVVSQARDSELGKLESQFGDTQTALQTLKTSIAAAPDTTKLEAELTALATQLTDVKARVADLAQSPARVDGVPAADGAALKALGQRIDSTAAEVTRITKVLDTQTQEAKQLAAGLEGLKSDVASTSAKADQALERAARAPLDAMAQLPLALSEMDQALHTGGSFAQALGVVSAALPDLSVPAEISAAASRGLGDPQALVSEFEKRVPEVLGAQPGKPDASWQERIFSRVKDLLAIRPAEPTSGNTPDAIVAQLEAAFGRGDFTTAQALYLKLPDPMRRASGIDPAQLDGLAKTQAFLAAARTMALTPNAGGTS